MSILLKPDGTKKEKERALGVNPRKMERTGQDTFVVKADGGNYFEGKITDQSKVKFKSSGSIVFSVGVCIRQCLNKGIKCDACCRFSELKPARDGA